MRMNFFTLSTVLLLSCISLQAQRSTRIGYIDMEYILENVQEYKDASQQLDQKVNKWKKEIEGKQSEIDEMKKQLNNERILLTKELIEEREEEIQFEEEQLLDYQQKRFGPGGDLVIQKRQLIEPVQDQVFNAVQEISANKKFDLVVNKSDVILLYAAERLDMSDQVLRSINRSSRRKQVNNRQEKDEVERDEARTVEEDKEVQARQAEADKKKDAREALLEERAKQREAQRDARKKEVEDRRQRLLEERQRRKDSIAAVRSGGAIPNSTKENEGEDAVEGEPVSKEKTEDKVEDPKKAAAKARAEKRQQVLKEREAQRQKDLEERKRKKDSALVARAKRRDSIINAKKNRNNTPTGLPDPNGGL